MPELIQSTLIKSPERNTLSQGAGMKTRSQMIETGMIPLFIKDKNYRGKIGLPRNTRYHPGYLDPVAHFVEPFIDLFLNLLFSTFIKNLHIFQFDTSFEILVTRYRNVFSQ